MKSLKEKEEKKDFSKGFMYSIHQLYFLTQKHLEKALNLHSSLSFSQFMILVGFQCRARGPVSQLAIAEQLYLTEATVSRHISTLVTLDYLSRVENKDNRRQHIISITPKGQKEFEKAGAIIDKELSTIFSIIKEKERIEIMKNFSEVLPQLLIKK